MKKLCFLSLIFLLITPSNSFAYIHKVHISSSHNLQQRGLDLPKYFYKRFEGKINNNLNIVMNLMRNDTMLSGNYYYEAKGIPIDFTFNSKIFADSSIYIGEETGQIDSSNSPVLSGEFKGKFINEHQIMGTWQKPNTPSGYYFVLIEKYPTGSIKLKTKQYGKSYNLNDSINAEIDFSFVQIDSCKDNNIKDSINYKISTAILNDYNFGDSVKTWNNFDEAMNDFINRYKESVSDTSLPAEFKSGWGNSFTTNVLFNSNNILAFENTEYRFEGGAHPLTYFVYENYNLLNGQEITLDELLKPNYKEALDKIGEQRFKLEHRIKVTESLKKTGYFLESGEFHLNKNFTISKSGLNFKFGEYEIGPYALGAPSVFIPYSDLRYLIKPDGLLAQFLK